MPSARHQVGAYALHKQPDVALSLLQATGVPLPPHDTMHVDSTKLPRNVNDLEADAVITLTRDGSAVASVILEIQLTWREPKTWTWPAYLASQRERRQCDVFLVVICLNTRTAQRCAEPIKLGHPGFVLTPIVIGPGRAPDHRRRAGQEVARGGRPVRARPPAGQGRAAHGARGAFAPQSRHVRRLFSAG